MSVMEDTATKSKPANRKQAPPENGALARHATRFSEELFNELLLWLEEGKTLSRFCVERKLGRRTIYDWMKRDPNLAARVTQARQLGCFAIEDEMRDIADSRDKSDPDDVQHRKLQLWMREKLLVWHDRARYGAKQQIDQRIEQRVVLTDIEREVRIKELLDKAAGNKPRIEVAVHEEDPSDAER
jgi:Bacteriophage Sf6, terminase small subunit-like